MHAEAPMEDVGLWVQMFLVALADVDDLAPMMADACLESMRRRGGAESVSAA